MNTKILIVTIVLAMLIATQPASAAPVNSVVCNLFVEAVG